MRVLVSVASKHGSTREIGEAIAAELRDRAIDVDEEPPSADLKLTDYDAVIIGSAVYGGSWRKEAVRFVQGRSDDLRALPVWLFQTGPVGRDDIVDEAHEGARLASAVGARGVTTFGGRLDPSQLTMGEKAIVSLVRAQPGDYRDFDAIRAWARHIADELHALPNPEGD
jgi:menaquinone-dependent protoporphyrinogen oxidase